MSLDLLADTNLSIALVLGMDVVGREANSKSTWTIQTGPENYNLSYTPDWARHIDLALQLPVPDTAQWNLIWHCHTGRDVASLILTPTTGYEHCYESRRPWGEMALAICLAWLEYRKVLTDTEN